MPPEKMLAVTLQLMHHGNGARKVDGRSMHVTCQTATRELVPTYNNNDDDVKWKRLSTVGRASKRAGKQAKRRRRLDTYYTSSESTHRLRGHAQACSQRCAQVGRARALVAALKVRSATLALGGNESHVGVPLAPLSPPPCRHAQA